MATMKCVSSRDWGTEGFGGEWWGVSGPHRQHSPWPRQSYERSELLPLESALLSGILVVTRWRNCFCDFACHGRWAGSLLTEVGRWGVMRRTTVFLPRGGGHVGPNWKHGTNEKHQAALILFSAVRKHMTLLDVNRQTRGGGWKVPHNYTSVVSNVASKLFCYGVRFAVCFLLKKNLNESHPPSRILSLSFLEMSHKATSLYAGTNERDNCGRVYIRSLSVMCPVTA